MRIPGRLLLSSRASCLSTGTHLTLTVVGIGASFHARTPDQFLLLFFVAVAYARLFALGAGVLQFVWRFRYLLLSTLAAHVLLSSGPTLLGTGWLFRQGLDAGMLMALRLGFSIAFAALLCLLTRPLELSAMLELLLKPFSRLGLAPGRLGAFWGLVLHFLPLVTQGKGRWASRRKQRSGGGRLREALALVESVLEQLLEDARRLSESTQGGRHLESVMLRPPTARDAFALLLSGAFLWLFWRLG